MEFVKNRRSVRNLKKGDLNWQEIEDIVRLAQNVPSAFNMQAVRYCIS
jgi:nitroreductase